MKTLTLRHLPHTVRALRTKTSGAAAADSALRAKVVAGISATPTMTRVLRNVSAAACRASTMTMSPKGLIRARQQEGLTTTRVSGSHL